MMVVAVLVVAVLCQYRGAVMVVAAILTKLLNLSTNTLASKQPIKVLHL
jgi:hypothetical protein